MRMVAEFCTLIDRQRADLVQENNGSAVRRRAASLRAEHCVTNLKTKSHFRGRHGRNAACGIYAQGWRARAIDMMRPNMKKGNSATSLLAACALSLSLSFNCETPPPEASFKNWSLSARKRNTPVRYGQARAQSRAQLGVCDGYHVRCRQSRAVHRRGNYYLSPPTLRSIFCCCLVDI